MPVNLDISSMFTEYFSFTADVVVHAPGRVNLIGDHTDYNDGFVLPAAINFGTDIAARIRNDDLVRVVAVDCNNEMECFELSNIQFSDTSMWSNYVRGTVLSLLNVYPDLHGVDLMVKGNVPQGAGLSSSASFEVAIVKALAEVNQLPINGVQAALIAQSAERDFVGCNCGIMDQLVSACGIQRHAMLLDCDSLAYKHAPIPDGLSLVIVNTNVKRTLVDSEYNLRREQCEAVASHFNVKALRDVTIEQLVSEHNVLPSVLFRRARHVISENTRTVNAQTALVNKDMKTMSRLMQESHHSLRDDFEVSTPELNFLVEIISKVLGNKGGVRMTGGGFGGCVVAITPTELVSSTVRSVGEQYQSEFGLEPSIYQCSVENGAFS
ncbi:galactokinase [Shewanella kaireitica]|uniref:galactokinase n=1 Tax=Shewanella kaireitica TaxID=212021 RepID=UPI00200EBADD|nr:galactokinase [Shewanella kaireitica]MCL1096121.1 galactokinase [Shewanella kaireitica]